MSGAGGPVPLPPLEHFSDLLTAAAVMSAQCDDDLSLEGSAAIDEHMALLLGSNVLRPMTVIGRHLCGPDEVVLKYSRPVDDLRRGLQFHDTCIGALRFAGGLMPWREHPDPLVLSKNAPGARS